MRLLAAKYANVDPATRGWRRILAAERECSFTPFLLAGRSNAELSDAELERFERHLETCLVCQAAELRFERAERAFDGVLRRDIALEAIAIANRSEQATVQFERVRVAAEPSIPTAIQGPSGAHPVGPVRRCRLCGAARPGSARPQLRQRHSQSAFWWRAHDARSQHLDGCLVSKPYGASSNTLACGRSWRARR